MDYTGWAISLHEIYAVVGRDNVEALVYVWLSAADEGEKVGRITTRSEKRG